MAGLAFAMIASAGVPESPEFRGRVIDAETKRPIAGALVTSNIGGAITGGHAGGRRNLHCDAVLADADGRFVFPAWKWSVGRSMDTYFSLAHYGSMLVAYHPDYARDRDAGRPYQEFTVVPFTGKTLKPSREATISLRRFSRNDRTAWRTKLTDTTFGYQCDWDADVSNTETFWNALHAEVEEYTSLAGEDPPGGPMYKLKWVTKRPVTEYQTVRKSAPARIEAKVASSAAYPSATSGAVTSSRIARVRPDPSRALQVGERVSLQVEVEYTVASEQEITLIVQADDKLISNTREVLKSGSGRVTLKSDFVVPDARKIQVYAPLTLRGGRQVPEGRVYEIRRAD